MVKENERKLYITKSWVVMIFLYYFILFLMGSISAGAIFISEYYGSLTIFHRALIGSVSISVSAASIAYIRKLYKLCFRYHSTQESDDQLTLKRIGTVAYFVFRPLFAGVFALVIVVGFRSGFLLISSAPDLEIDEGFIYLTMASSFYVGFLSGDYIKKLEKKGVEKINSFVG